MNPHKGLEKNGARTEALAPMSPMTPVERLVRAPLYPGALSSVGNAQTLDALWSDSLTARRCLLRFRGAGSGNV